MTRQQNLSDERAREIDQLMAQLHRQDLSIDDKVLKRILVIGDDIVPELAQVVEQTIEKSRSIDPSASPKGTEWCTLIHALFLLAHLRAEDTLDLVLELLAHDQSVIDYWLHDLLNDDLWEIIFLLGCNQIEELEEFVTNEANNPFSRLAVCTAMVQIALHFPARYEEIVRVFRGLLRLPHSDSDYVGLLASELLDLCEPALKPFILDNLERYQVWQGLITAAEVEEWYRRLKPHRRVPLDLFERYTYYKQYPYFSKTEASQTASIDAVLREASKSNS
jgi:hypothetical protein